jgi:hypothetical protein
LLVRGVTEYKPLKCLLGLRIYCRAHYILWTQYSATCEEYYKKKEEALKRGEEPEENEVCELLASPYSRNWLMYYCDRCIKSAYAKRFIAKTHKMSTVSTL